MAKEKKELTYGKAADFIASNLFQVSPENMELAEEVRLLAFGVLKQMEKAVIFIEAEDKSSLRITWNEKIGELVANQDVSKDIAGQRYYCIATLAFEIAALAKQQVEDGYSIDKVLSDTLEAISRHLSEQLSVQVSASNLFEDYEDDTHKGTLPS